MYSVKILKDSLGPTGKRLTTFELTYPRFVHSELMTHKKFSRNSASSRAIPISKMIEQVVNNPVFPKFWGKSQAGMQAREELSQEEIKKALAEWLTARDEAVESVKNLMAIGLHKQISNRLLEPWMFITVIVSATEYDNFFKLRAHPDAQPEIARVATEMQSLYKSNKPDILIHGDWHLPLIFDEDRENNSVEDLCKISTGRCARVSYLTHNGKRDHSEDIRLHNTLTKNGHWSPFEHVAMALDNLQPSGNFIGFKQYRKCFKDEHFPLLSDNEHYYDYDRVE